MELSESLTFVIAPLVLFVLGVLLISYGTN